MKYILNNKTVLVDGKKRKDYRYPVGLFDVITFEDTKESYRVVLDEKGKIAVVKAKEGTSKLATVCR